MRLELWDAFADGRPHDVRVNIEIAMDEMVSHADDEAPWHFGVPISKCLRQVSRRFTDDLQPTHHPRLRPFVAVERLAAREILLNPGNCVENIEETRPIASHKSWRLDGNGFAQHPIAHSRAESALGHDIHTSAQ